MADYVKPESWVDGPEDEDDLEWEVMTFEELEDSDIRLRRGRGRGRANGPFAAPISRLDAPRRHD